MRIFLYFFSITLVVSVISIAIANGNTATISETKIVDGLEPPVNPYLADSPWPMAHRGPYSQASSPFEGITEDDLIEVNHLSLKAIPFFPTYSSPYGNGERTIWGATSSQIIKIDPEGNRLSHIDSIDKEIIADNKISGGYTILDIDNNFYVPTGNKIDVYTDAVVGDPYSDILKVRSFVVPENALRGGENESIIGFNMTYDGMLIFVTELGTVGVVSRDFSEFQYIQLEEGEKISNSVAVDENGGIYVVTSKKMHRIQWDGTELNVSVTSGAWFVDYETGPENPTSGRLGPGSGSTPTLMGTGDQDKFVVITDGQELMHLVLFWRDEIPPEWESIAPGKDRRIAAEVPVTFGNPDATSTTSEQSALVRGYGVLVVNNYYNIQFPGFFPDLFDLGLVLFSNLNAIVPHGVEKFEWNSQTRNIEKRWTNKNVSCPNGVPTMSAATGLAYCIGTRNSKWTLEALDWDTGKSVFSHKLGILPRYNSMYSACEIGPNRTIITGMFSGILHFVNK